MVGGCEALEERVTVDVRLKELHGIRPNEINGRFASIGDSMCERGCAAKPAPDPPAGVEGVARVEWSVR